MEQRDNEIRALFNLLMQMLIHQKQTTGGERTFSSAELCKCCCTFRITFAITFTGRIFLRRIRKGCAEEGILLKFQSVSLTISLCFSSASSATFRLLILGFILQVLELHWTNYVSSSKPFPLCFSATGILTFVKIKHSLKKGNRNCTCFNQVLIRNMPSIPSSAIDR